MSARRIVVTSGKGGVGKTTTTANVGAALAKRGHRVTLIDADIGLRNLDLVLGVEKRIVFDLVEVVEGRCQLRQALIRDKRFETLAILPAAQTRDKDAVTEQQMARVVEDVAAMCDFVLVDSPAGIEHGFRNAVASATEAIVVTTPEVSSIRDADRVIGKLVERQLPIRLIVNRIRTDMVRSGDMMSVDDVCEILSSELLGTCRTTKKSSTRPIAASRSSPCRSRGWPPSTTRSRAGSKANWCRSPISKSPAIFGRLFAAFKAG